MKAWLFQDHRQKQRLGDDCPWSVGWIDPEGKRKSKRLGTKSAAEKHQRKVEGQLAAGVYENKSRKDWAAFRTEYEAKILPRLAYNTQRLIKTTLEHFERIAKPGKLATLTTATIDAFISERQTDAGKKPESKTSPATINKDLRHLKSVLRVAAEWGYLVKVPKFRKVREEVRMGHVVTAEHFQTIYEACDSAARPVATGYLPAEWWRALLTFALTTGWRIEEILSLKRDDLDLDTGAIMTRAGDNKGRRDDADYLPGAALDHVKRIVGFNPLVFFWPHDQRTLWVEFHRIQEAAQINLPCPYADRHECTASCHWYGFHALRRGYATLNADRMSAPALQKKMRHRSFTTTLRYIQLSDKMKKAADVVYVPEFLTAKASG
jgi:integrase